MIDVIGGFFSSIVSLVSEGALSLIEALGNIF